MSREHPSRGVRRPDVVTIAALTSLALAIRLTAVLAWSRTVDPAGDEAFYWRQAQYLGQGAGFVYRNNFGEQISTAVHPPLYSAYLGLIGLLHLPEGSHLPYRLGTALLGALAVGVMALVALRLAGRTAAIATGVLAAVYPNLWFNDVKLTAESLYALTIAVVLLAAHGYHRRPTTRGAVFLGVAVAAAALTRAEAVFLVGLVVIPLALLARSEPWRARARRAAIGTAAAAIVLAPWLVRNLTGFTHPATLSSGSGFVVEISNCDASFGLAPPVNPGDTGPPPDADTLLGYWHESCDRSSRRMYGDAAVSWPAGDETVVEAWKRGIGLDYVAAHKRQLPVVLAARVGRIWDVWRPGQSIALNEFFEGRRVTTADGTPTVSFQTLAMGEHYALLALAVVGLVALRRRRETILPYLALAASATLTAAISFGITRYRVGADVGLVVLAGVAVAFVVDRLRTGRRTGDPTGVPA